MYNPMLARVQDSLTQRWNPMQQWSQARPLQFGPGPQAMQQPQEAPVELPQAQLSPMPQMNTQSHLDIPPASSWMPQKKQPTDQGYNPQQPEMQQRLFNQPEYQFQRSPYMSY